MFRVCGWVVKAYLLPLKLATSYTRLVKDFLVEVIWTKPSRENLPELDCSQNYTICAVKNEEISTNGPQAAASSLNETLTVSVCPGAFVETKHGKTHYILRGPENGPLVVFSHGVSLFCFVWMKLAEQFNKKGFRVLIYDFYGHGYSSSPFLNYTHDLFLMQLEEVLTNLNLIQAGKKLILVGHSMGGMVSCYFAARHPELVSQLILINSVGLPIKIELTNFLLSFMYAGMKFLRRTTAVDGAVYALAKWLRKQAEKSAHSFDDLCTILHTMDETKLLTKEEVKLLRNAKQILVKMALKCASSNIVRFVKSLNFLYHTWLHQCRNGDLEDKARVALSVVRHCPLLDANLAEHIKMLHGLEDAVEQPKIPILIIWGQDDGITPVALIQDFLKYIPHAEVLTIPDTDHSVFLQQPLQIFNAMIAFIENHSLRDSVSVPVFEQMESISVTEIKSQ
jgi:pimeloyl-ACP methyl ester carboxylesterase